MVENIISISQYFEQTNERLERIEKGLLAQKNVLTFEEMCLYRGISKSHGYKETMARKIQFSKPDNKLIYFLREDVENYMLQNPIKTAKQLKLAINQTTKRPTK